MGTLMGHVLPGSFFITASMWWLWVLLHRYFKSRLPKGKASAKYDFKSSLSVACPCTGNRFPLLGVAVIFLVSVGITGEVVTGFSGGKFVNHGNGQHITMYFFFGMAAMCEVLRFYRMPLPKDTDYALFLLALLIEAMLFFHHLHGRIMLDVQIHMYLVYVILGCVACTAVEMKHRKNVLAAMGRVILTMVQGFWFITVGWMLYPPPGSPVWGKGQNEHAMHDEIMIATTIFAMHIAAGVVFAFLMGIFVSIRVRRLGQYAPTYELRMPGALPVASESRLPPFGETDDEDDEDVQPRALNIGDGHVMSPATNSSVA